MKEALLLIDLQNDYYKEGKMPLENITVTSHNAKKVLEHFRATQKPIVHIQHIMTHADAPFFVKESEGAAIYHDLLPQGNEAHFIKHYPSSFQGTPLEIYLHKESITTLVIVGAMSHMCIDTTVRSAFEKGFTCKLLHDACATKALSFQDSIIPAQTVHQTMMAAIQGTFATVMSTNEYLTS